MSIPLRAIGLYPAASPSVLCASGWERFVGLELRDTGTGGLLKRWVGLDASAYVEGFSPSNGLVAVTDDRNWADLRVMELR